MSKTQELISRRKSVVARGVGIFAGEISADTAKGALITDLDGREMIDFVGGIGVVNTGHCEETVVAAIREQAGKLLHTCIHIASYEPYVKLCEELVRILPHGGETKCMLVNSGAEAVENAIKIARQHTQRSAILCYEGAFHGRTLMGMSLTAKSGYKKHCGPFASEIYRLPYPDHFRCGDGLDLDAFVDRELHRFRDRFVRGPLPADHFAAVIIEVVQGEGGFTVAPPAYLQGLREICDEFGIVLICDEVQSGFARTGTWGAYEHAGIVPDISTWAKALGSGLPISAVIGKANIMDAAEPGTIGGTYGGNPVACAASIATIDVIERENLKEQAVAVGSTIRTRFEALYEKCSVVGDVRGLGAMMAIELCHDKDPRQPATEITRWVVNRCREQGVLVLTAGPYSNVIRILSPLTIDDTILNKGLDVIESAILDAAGRTSTL
ncbi:MAG: 4-aminobutyrate--2-oxoglutarate transaminase [Myxococcales bacterium]|nr:4-aminobutyrate--2-oxoglutarate transaminase [Myxococcales bacterium]